jgi:hypothetical protein
MARLIRPQARIAGVAVDLNLAKSVEVEAVVIRKDGTREFAGRARWERRPFWEKLKRWFTCHRKTSRKFWKEFERSRQRIRMQG